MDSKKIDVKIGDHNYTLLGNQSEEYVRKVASYVDKKIELTKNSNRKMSVQMYTTLAAINIANDYFEAIESLKDIKEVSKDALDNYGPTLKRVEDLTEENDKLLEDIDKLKDDLVNSLNTIGDINKGFVIIQDENKNMKDLLVDRENQIKVLENNLTSMQSDFIQLQKKLETISKSIEENK